MMTCRRVRGLVYGDVWFEYRLGRGYKGYGRIMVDVLWWGV